LPTQEIPKTNLTLLKKQQNQPTTTMTPNQQTTTTPNQQTTTTPNQQTTTTPNQQTTTPNPPAN
jgi:hypothetical protein